MKAGDRVKIVGNTHADCWDQFVGRTGVIDRITTCGYMDYEVFIDPTEEERKAGRMLVTETVPFDAEELEVI